MFRHMLQNVFINISISLVSNLIIQVSLAYPYPLFKVCVVKRWNIYMHNPILKCLLARKRTWTVNAIWALSDFLFETHFFGFISEGTYVFWPDALLLDIVQQEVYVKDTFTYTHMKREIKNISTGFCIIFAIKTKKVIDNK